VDTSALQVAQVTSTVSLAFTLITMILITVLMAKDRPDRLIHPGYRVVMICLMLFAGKLIYGTN